MKKQVALILNVLVAVSAVACSPNRNRPGPPRVTIDFPGGSTVFSPDSFQVDFRAMDDDGLDSLNLRWGTLTFDVETGFRTEASATFMLQVPPGIRPGTELTVWVRARDLVGQATDQIQTVSVIAGPSP